VHSTPKQINICLPAWGLFMKRKPALYCRCCGTELERTHASRKFCNNLCQQKHIHKEYVERWKSGEENGRKGLISISSHIRRYLFEKYDSKCMRCGWNSINPSTGKSPLEINHKDGDWKNNIEENLELLCPNCHSLEPTYKALNRGKGRYMVHGVVNPGNGKKRG
jgi:hypothetical protein